MNANQQAIVHDRRVRRQRRVRKKLQGSIDRPRLSVFRSSKHIYAQVVNDENGRTLAAASSVDRDAKAEGTYGGNIAAAVRVGKLIASRAKSAGIDRVCFDRRSYKYHGRIKALADAAREGGLQF